MITTAIERCRDRIAEYVATGDECWRNGARASARAWWRKAGTAYANAHGLQNAVERSKQRMKRRGR